jgi:hypothetical protein
MRSAVDSLLSASEIDEDESCTNREHMRSRYASQDG